MEGHDEEERLRRIEEKLDRVDRLARIEEKLDRLLEREASAVDGEQISAEPEGDADDERVSPETEVGTSDADADTHPADLALSVRSAKRGRDGMYVCLAEIANYGEGAANRVRWWLSTQDGEIVSTVSGEHEVRISPGETVELEVVEVPGWENFPFQHLWCRLAWHDAEGDHEGKRPYVESARGMWKWKRKRKTQ